MGPVNITVDSTNTNSNSSSNTNRGGGGGGWGYGGGYGGYPTYVGPTGVFPYQTLPQVIAPAQQYVVPVANPSAVQTVYSPDGIPGMDGQVWDSPMLGDSPVYVTETPETPEPDTEQPVVEPVWQPPPVQTWAPVYMTTAPEPGQKSGFGMSTWMSILCLLAVVLAIGGAYVYMRRRGGRSSGGAPMFL